MSKTALDRAIEIAGGAQKLAEALGIRHQAVYAWGDQVPASRAIEIERLTGVPRHELRPDFWEAP